MKIEFNSLYNENKNYKKKFFKKLHLLFNNSDFINGKYNKIFEAKFSKVHGKRYCKTCANGTDAIYLAVKSLLKKKNNQVITTSHSWISTASAIKNAGGNVIFVDTANDYNINVNIIEKKITSKTEGLVIVHLYGKPCNMIEIKKIVKKYKLWLIEDCSQAHFAKYKNKIVGSFGDVATFSFYPSKNFGSLGDAGAIVCKNFKIFQKIKKLSNNGSLDKKKFSELGINSRMDNLHAAFLLEKFKDFKKTIKKKKKIANFYLKKLSNVNEICLPDIKDSVIHQFVIRAKKRNDLKSYLKSKNIETMIHYNEILPKSKIFNKKFNKKLYENSYYDSKNILSIPSHINLNRKELEYICHHIKNFYEKR